MDNIEVVLILLNILKNQHAKDHSTKALYDVSGSSIATYYDIHLFLKIMGVIGCMMTQKPQNKLDLEGNHNISLLIYNSSNFSFELHQNPQLAAPIKSIMNLLQGSFPDDN